MGFTPPPPPSQGPFGPFFPQPGPPGPPPGSPGSIGQQAPTAPPPSFVPQISPYAVDPGAISGCLFRNTYVWLRNRDSFWFFPIFVGPRSVAGFRFFGGRWAYFGIDLNQISSFTCF
ncbi:collagen-like protein [Paenibacillus anaericanus]|uniref:Collagen-like protein n=1 Tax=Paenibacillus anaericanus TaxID=170367 RepID=A0A433Y5Y4_9BACL|nr:collagen-like protein [Paenibacillus anaericanus]RUT43963.1 collagen-like protein [Paenibacillus anaericanus]